MKYIASLIISMTPFLAVYADNLKIDVPVNHNWWWNAPEVPQIPVHVSDTTASGKLSYLTLSVASDREPGKKLITMGQYVSPGAGEIQEVLFSPALPEPGFYVCTVSDDGKEAKRFTIGYEPENIVSLPDNQSDLREFWDRALEELAAVAPEYVIIPRQDVKSKVRDLYLVKMKSWGGEQIQGYLAVPKKKGKYPAFIYYNGYNAEPWEFDTVGSGDKIEFLLFGRGQGLNKPNNKYGDWIQYNLQDPENYYYKGAFMDCVRAIDFVEQLPKTDTRNIFAEGGSQGGAFTLAAAALDPKHRLRAIAPYIPFLSDYPDYFKIAPWPGNVVLSKAREINLGDQDLYRNLSYFDLKNLARWIDIPVLMGVGLQDPTCPPHINFSSFNLIDSDKEFVIYPTLGHTVDYEDWCPRRDAFFEKVSFEL